TSNYQIDLPEDLKRRRIHNMFHINRLRRHEANDNQLFPHRETQVHYDLGNHQAKEYLVDEIVDHFKDGRTLKFKVRWNLGDVTWEPLEHVNAAQALDDYLALQGVS
ncbi:hypothetical protein BDW22DRAFT_1307418, partial [Trametopsis cervina]